MKKSNTQLFESLDKEFQLDSSHTVKTFFWKLSYQLAIVVTVASCGLKRQSTLDVDMQLKEVTADTTAHIALLRQELNYRSHLEDNGTLVVTDTAFVDSTLVMRDGMYWETRTFRKSGIKQPRFSFIATILSKSKR